MPDDDLQLSPRYEVRVHWEDGRKRFALHDLHQDRLVEKFDSLKDASVQCALLWLEHVSAVRLGSSAAAAPLTSFPKPNKAP